MPICRWPRSGPARGCVVRNYPRVFSVIEPSELSEDLASASAQRRLQRGHRLLVLGGELDETGLHRLASDPFVLPKALAYYDVVCAKHRPPAQRTQVLVLASDAFLETSEGLLDWMKRQVVGTPDARFEQMAQQLCRTECYQLVRFVLEQPVGTSIALMAKRYGLSDVHFHRLCKRYFGQSLKRQLRVLRVASTLLERPEHPRSFTDLALGHGYASASHFCTEVRQLMGQSPTSIYKMI